MEASFLQSAEWMEFQKSLWRQVWHVESDHISAKVMEVKLPLGKHYLYAPFGPVIDFNAMQGSIKQEVSGFIQKLINLAREQEAIFIKIEPQFGSVAEVMVAAGFKKPKKETTSHKTVILDIDRSEEELLGGMHHKTRYNIGLAEKKGIEVRESDDVKSFVKLVKETNQRNRGSYPLYSKDYYQKFLEFFSDDRDGLKSKLFLAYDDSEAIAGAIILTDSQSETAYYMYGGSGRKHAPLMAPYLLHWQIIKYLQGINIKKYDLWMIDSQKWPGVTRFKLGWLAQPNGRGAGGVIDYPGSFDLPIRKFWYFVYKTYRTIFK